MNSRIFRQYDIRGVADRDLTDEVVTPLGRAFVRYLDSGSGAAPVVAVGRDCRLTSDRLRDALVRGITGAGGRVLDIGVVPTPVLYFAAGHYSPAGSIIITGSHNPAPDNGFKLMRGRATLHGDEIQAVRRLTEAEAGATGRLADDAPVESRDAVGPYLDNAIASIAAGERRFKVVVDAGNGTGGPVACELYRRLGFDVHEIFCDMDGRFPNHHPDPTVAENLRELQRAVVDTGAELGIALDGDADRIGAVDSRGRILWGDQLMILFGRAILEEHPGASFIGEVKCSQALYDELEKAGGKPLMWKVGHSLIKAKMAETGALLAGEMSGHIFFAHRYLGFDDGIYAGARLLELLSRGSRSLADLYDTLPQMVNTPEIRVDCPDEVKFSVVDRIASRLRARADVTGVVDVDGVRVNFGDAWGLVRASNTQPALVLRCEAGTRARLDQVRAILDQEIAAAQEDA